MDLTWKPPCQGGCQALSFSVGGVAADITYQTALWNHSISHAAFQYLLAFMALLNLRLPAHGNHMNKKNVKIIVKSNFSGDPLPTKLEPTTYTIGEMNLLVKEHARFLRLNFKNKLHTRSKVVGSELKKQVDTSIDTGVMTLTVRVQEQQFLRRARCPSSLELHPGPGIATIICTRCVSCSQFIIFEKRAWSMAT